MNILSDAEKAIEGDTKTMDKMLAVIIIFFAISALLAGFLLIGAIPELFKQSKQLNQTQTIINQTQLFIEQKQYEDQARANQTAYEDKARDKQATQIVKDTNKSLNVLQNNITKYIKESEQRSQIANKERDSIQTEIISLQKALNTTIDMLLQMTKKDNTGAEDHRNQSLDNHQKIIEYLDKIYKK